MTKMIGMAEFKANCTRLLRELQAGETITVTSRGKPVAVVTAPEHPPKLGTVFGMLRSDRYRFDADPSEPAVDPAEWEANNPAELYRKP